MFNPYLAVVLATIIWGSAGIFIKYLDLPPTTIAFFRAFIPAAILYGYFKIKKVKVFKYDLKLILLASATGALQFFLYFIAYSNTSIANSLIMLYTWPIFVAIFSTIFLKEVISIRNIFLFVPFFAGVVLVYSGESASFSNKDFIGITSMLFASILFALMVIIFKRLSVTHTNFEIIFYHNFTSAIVFIPFFLMNPLPTAIQFPVAAVYSFLIGLVAYIPYYFGLKHIKASTVSLLSYTEVVSGILFAVVLLNETLTLNIVAGGILIIGSALLIKK